MATTEHFTKAEFMKEIGIKSNNFGNYAQRGHFKIKNLYTQADIDYFKKHHKPKPRKSNNASVTIPDVDMNTIYTGKEFSKLSGIGYSTIYTYQNSGKLPKILTQRALLDWLAKNPKPEIKIDKNKTFTRAELQEYYTKQGRGKYYVSTLIGRKHLPNKDLYTFTDIENLSKKISHRKGHKKTNAPASSLDQLNKYAAHAKTLVKSKIDLNNPFELVEDVILTTSIVNGITTKLIERMLGMDIHDGDKYKTGFMIPAKLYPTSQKASAAVSYAKQQIRKNYKTMANSEYKIQKHLDQAGTYTHSIVLRIA